MRAIVLIMDSFGIGATPDAERFGDAGSNTLGHIADHCLMTRSDARPLTMPHLEQWGLGLAGQLASGSLAAGFNPNPKTIAACGAAKEASSGKDTPSGHWELAGVPVRFDWGYFLQPQDTFPEVLLNNLARRAGLPGFLGNCHSSGTVVLEQFGEEHMKTGKPIVYTSADSVFQIACHEETFGLEQLYQLCDIAREEVDPYNICRVIARPFVGNAKTGFTRTGNRHDLAVPPPADTVLKKLVDAGGHTIAIGKISDIYAGVGISTKIKANGLDALWDATFDSVKQGPDFSLIVTNFVDFDQNFGHRRDVEGYAQALEQFDLRLPELYSLLREDDVVIITADHGCDPTLPGSDHTREHVPVLVYGKRIVPESLGIRDTFIDIGQSLATLLICLPSMRA